LVGEPLASGNFKDVKEEGTITLTSTRISQENKLLELKFDGTCLG
jgi:hypothetical protein